MTQLPQQIYFRQNGEANSYALIDKDLIKWVMALLLNGEYVQDKQIEILERMAACWNACQNIETTVLEEHALGVISAEHSQQRNELLEALKLAVNALERSDYVQMDGDSFDVVDVAREVIRKTTGGAQ